MDARDKEERRKHKRFPFREDILIDGRYCVRVMISVMAVFMFLQFNILKKVVYPNPAIKVVIASETKQSRLFQ
jgi:hypothetical protein